MGCEILGCFALYHIDIQSHFHEFIRPIKQGESFNSLFTEKLSLIPMIQIKSTIRPIRSFNAWIIETIHH